MRLARTKRLHVSDPVHHRYTGARPDDAPAERLRYLPEFEDATGLGRFNDDAELLRRAGVVVAGGQPIVAGLLALGVHPQQFFPRYVIQAAIEPLPQDPPSVRARNLITITGPIPRMLDAALDWARRTFATNIVKNPNGSVTDQPAYPLLAFRGIIANALIHRDLDDWSQAFAIEVRLRRDRLVVTILAACMASPSTASATTPSPPPATDAS